MTFSAIKTVIVLYTVSVVKPKELERASIAGVHPSVAEGPRSLRDMRTPGPSYMSSHARDGTRYRPIALEEKGVFADLLGRLLEYVPTKRITAKDFRILIVYIVVCICIQFVLII